MTYYALANADITSARRGRRDVVLVKAQKNHQAILFILAGVILGLLMVYIFVINDIVRSTYELRALTKSDEELKDQNKALELETARRRAIPDLQNAVDSLNLVAIDAIEYIDAGKPSSLALNK